jgi:hypothetical protein
MSKIRYKLAKKKNDLNLDFLSVYKLITIKTSEMSSTISQAMFPEMTPQILEFLLLASTNYDLGLSYGK